MELSCDELKTALVRDMEKVGITVSPSKAVGYLRTYFQGPAQPANKEEWVYGHLFGIDSMNKFMKTINAYNAQAQIPENDKITGIRIYNAKSQREDDPYAALGILHDVFIVPVKKDGMDYFPEIGSVQPVVPEAVVEPLYILGQSRPCPNQCGSGLLLAIAD